ncbi:putative pollen-specific leucine-rich repeat extensin-like protein 3 [Iris pallida]|uniref:Pollen-specific leucine-rich repeat extensin-like protein 3 n=1 Tax=Iris pallida TaxID=29817 RepID=A0AAX6HJ80_IRIPA|nr:putative pollen-specific leucine-rich repeat extensin-like protein 3 [Iris pallida]
MRVLGLCGSRGGAGRFDGGHAGDGGDRGGDRVLNFCGLRIRGVGYDEMVGRQVWWLGGAGEEWQGDGGSDVREADGNRRDGVVSCETPAGVSGVVGHG